MKFKKIMAAAMSAALAIGTLAGCSPSNGKNDSTDKITIKVGGWPSEEGNKEAYTRMESIKKKFEEKYSDIKVEEDEWGFDLNTFLPKAASGQLPDVYITSITEMKRIIRSGYASNVSKYMKKYKYTDYLRDDILKLISDDKGEIYALPKFAYSMGLLINLKLFREAGLVKEDGTPQIPETWEQVAQYAQTVKQKTGKAGFSMATMNNVGGWHFMNIAWAYGVTKEFAKQENGSWTADFATPEGTAALQFVKDLKWKYDAVGENALLDFDEMYKMFATGRTAMMVADPPMNALIEQYGMKNSDIAAVSMPAGPAGRFNQIGGELYVMKNGLSDEVIDACFKWLQFNGTTPELTDDVKENIDSQYKMENEKGYVVGIRKYSMWKSDNIPPVQKYEDEVRTKYTNINPKMFTDYENFDKVTPIAEPPVSCQQLYSLLDGCIQNVWTDKNADPEKLMKDAANKYQVNYLDKEKN